MTNITFLEEYEMIKLNLLKDYGYRSAITDFSILLGGDVSNNYCTCEGYTQRNRTGKYWTKTKTKIDDTIYVCDHSGVYVNEKPETINGVGGRPVLPYSSIKNCITNQKRITGDYILEIEYGEYPQDITSSNLSDCLEKKNLNGTLKKTGKNYTITTNQSPCNYGQMVEKKYPEYIFNEKKYIRFIYDKASSKIRLSDESRLITNKVYWIEIKPIKWIVDEKADLALSKKILFAGVPFNEIKYDGDFKNTTIKKFMDDYFSKEIIEGTIYESNNTNQHETKINRRKNPYNFSFDRVTEEDIIKGAVESNISVFLHGRSSEGKSARVKQLDPDCEIIYLRNATPDSLNGKSVYNSITGEMIDVPPTWYKKIKQKCDEEPDKIHIIFFDEITNALPSIQGMAFNIILDKEVNGIWKLPENSRIIAAGNDLKDSLAANAMAEPLFNRFAHVYINTTVDSWLKWASTPNENYQRLDHKKEKSTSKIHPAIYSYIAMNGEKVLRTEYNGERPNADPRKWEMASRVLYQTKKPEMLRALIGENITADFVNFCKQEVITIEDVINGNYTEEELRYMSSSEKYATALSLSQVDENNFKVVREFMKKIGEEARATFDSMWASGNEERLELIAELDLEEQEYIMHELSTKKIRILKPTKQSKN